MFVLFLIAFTELKHPAGISYLNAQAKEFHPNGLNPGAKEFIPAKQVLIFN